MGYLFYSQKISLQVEGILEADVIFTCCSIMLLITSLKKGRRKNSTEGSIFHLWCAFGPLFGISKVLPTNIRGDFRESGILGNLGSGL